MKKRNVTHPSCHIPAEEVQAWILTIARVMHLTGQDSQIGFLREPVLTACMDQSCHRSRHVF